MAKVDKKYCFQCKRSTLHDLRGSKSDFEGLGIARAAIAISSFGLSELSFRTKYWQCSECGKIKED